MPLISVQIPEEKYDKLDKTPLLKSLSEIVSRQTGKPEAYCMATISRASIMMAGITRPAAFIDVRSIGGLSTPISKSISSELGFMLSSKLDIPKDRIYVNFTEFDPSKWGWNGGTF